MAEVIARRLGSGQLSPTSVRGTGLRRRGGMMDARGGTCCSTSMCDASATNTRRWRVCQHSTVATAVQRTSAVALFLASLPVVEAAAIFGIDVNQGVLLIFSVIVFLFVVPCITKIIHIVRKCSHPTAKKHSRVGRRACNTQQKADEPYFREHVLSLFSSLCLWCLLLNCESSYVLRAIFTRSHACHASIIIRCRNA